MSIILERESAKKLLVISRKAFSAGSKEMLLKERPAHVEQKIDKFVEEFKAFMEYLELMIGTDIEEITIPDHHRSIFLSIKAAALMMISSIEAGEY